MKNFLFLFFISISIFATERKIFDLVEYPPFLEKDQSGEIKGYFAEVVAASFEAMDVNYDYQFMPVERMRIGFIRGTNNIWVGDKETFKGTKVYKESTEVPILNCYMVLIANKGKRKDSFNFADIKGQVVGVLRGFEEEVKSLEKFGPKFIFVDKHSQLFEMLRLKRIDYASIAEVSVYQYLIENPSTKKTIEILPHFLKQSIGLVFNKKSSKIRETFKKGLELIKESGKYEKVILKNLQKYDHPGPQKVLIE